MRITLILLLMLCLLWAWCLPGNEVETVSMYMYNGVKLPAPPEYDTETYHKAYIAENVAMKGWYALFISDKPLVYDKLTNTMIRQDGSTVMRCVCTGEAWGEFVAHESDSLLAPIWANYDVLDTNGDVRLYATEPAKMWENARSFLIGLAMAFAGKPLPISQGEKEPIGYLYGHIAKEGETPTHSIDGVNYVGIIAPPLPDWAYTRSRTAILRLGNTYRLVEYEDVSYHRWADDGAYFIKMLNRLETDLINNAWSEDVRENEGDSVAVEYEEIIWTIPSVMLHDVETGKWITAVKKCDPIPIYAQINPNLASVAKMSNWASVPYERAGFKWIVTKNAVNGGMRFDPSGLTVGETYTISYRIQKQSGVLKTIRGHCQEGFTPIRWSIDGVEQTDTYNSNDAAPNVADDDSIHYVVFTGIYKASGSENGFFIQPNRMQSVNVEVAIWDFKVELGDKATPWIPAEEDM